MKIKANFFRLLFLCAVMICPLLTGACAVSGPAPETAAGSAAFAETTDDDPSDASAGSPTVTGSAAKTVAASSFVFPDSEPQAGSSESISTAGSSEANPSSASSEAELPVKSVSPTPAADAPTKTPSPSPSKNPAGSLEGLEENLKDLIKDFDGTWSIYCKRLDTEESFCINDESLIAASLIKLFIFGAAMEAIEDGEMDFDYYSEPLELMIEYSDNDSANLLVEDMGGVEVVNDFIDRHGYKDTEMYRYMAEDSFLENFTSAKECGELLEDVLDGKYVSEEASELLLYHLKNQDTLYKIPAGLPDGVKTASKSGELDDAQHDAAIVFSPACTYILVVMSNDLEPYYEGAEDAIDQICEISENVYNYVQHKLPDDG